MTDTSREALIATLSYKFKNEWGDDSLREAANMLEADGKPKNFLRLRGQLEQEWSEVRALKEANKQAQQVAVPATGERAELIARLKEAQIMMDYDPVEAHAAMEAAIDMLEADAVRADKRVDSIATDRNYWREKAQQAQAVEPVVTGATHGLSQDYSKGLGRWFADRPGARQQLIEDCKQREAQQVAVPAVGNTTCNPHPDAPHGFDRNASHSAGRYVCDCEGWMPDSRPQNCGTGHCSCLVCPYQKQDWSAA